MSTNYQILPVAQKALVSHLAGLSRLNFALYGGTAIALRLGHRQSVDFDFFSNTGVNQDILRRALPLLNDAAVIQDEENAWSVLAYPMGTHERPVKLSFFGNLSFGRVDTPTFTDNGELVLASPYDLLGHKLKVLLQRVESKDYQDIAALLRSGLQLERGLGASAALFGPTFPVAECLRTLTYFNEGDLSQLNQTDRTELVDATGRVKRSNPMPIVSKNLIPGANDRDYGLAEANLQFCNAFLRSNDQDRGLLNLIFAVAISDSFTDRDTNALATLAPPSAAPLVQHTIAIALRNKPELKQFDCDVIKLIQSAPRYSVNEQTVQALMNAGGSDILAAVVTKTISENKIRDR